MNLQLDISLAANYHSRSQITRVLTESWIAAQMYCPRCGCPKILHFPNGRPVADFYCPNCKSEYELKSKSRMFRKRAADGAYSTMIERITGDKNPDFFFLSYSKENMQVRNLTIIPKHFFVPGIIERRKKLSMTARRAGWEGCNILLEKIPLEGRISVISNGIATDKNTVMKKVARVLTLDIDGIEARGWLMDVLRCINILPGPEFTLADVYRFEEMLRQTHPHNHNIQAKIRQQLQILRDKGFIVFLGRGRYKKT